MPSTEQVLEQWGNDLQRQLEPLKVGKPLRIILNGVLEVLTPADAVERRTSTRIDLFLDPDWVTQYRALNRKQNLDPDQETRLLERLTLLQPYLDHALGSRDGIYRRLPNQGSRDNRDRRDALLGRALGLNLVDHLPPTATLPGCDELLDATQTTFYTLAIQAFGGRGWLLDPPPGTAAPDEIDPMGHVEGLLDDADPSDGKRTRVVARRLLDDHPHWNLTMTVESLDNAITWLRNKPTPQQRAAAHHHAAQAMPDHPSADVVTLVLLAVTGSAERWFPHNADQLARACHFYRNGLPVLQDLPQNDRDEYALRGQTLEDRTTGRARLWGAPTVDVALAAARATLDADAVAAYITGTGLGPFAAALRIDNQIRDVRKAALHEYLLTDRDTIRSEDPTGDTAVAHVMAVSLAHEVAVACEQVQMQLLNPRDQVLAAARTWLQHADLLDALSMIWGRNPRLHANGAAYARDLNRREAVSGIADAIGTPEGGEPPVDPGICIEAANLIVTTLPGVLLARMPGVVVLPGATDPTYP